jgi:hypothetical protein
MVKCLAYSIKKHEVDRLLNVLIMLGWELREEKHEERGITLVIHRELSEGLVMADAEAQKIVASK